MQCQFRRECVLSFQSRIWLLRPHDKQNRRQQLQSSLIFEDLLLLILVHPKQFFHLPILEKWCYVPLLAAP